MVIADLDKENKSIVLLKGGRGGKGNSNFATSTNQAPRYAENGKEGIVQFDGIVVRTEPETESDEVKIYRMAVFFTHVPSLSMEILSRIISNNL